MLVGSNGGAQHGTVSMDSHGNFIYMPTTGYIGPDSFSFMASDGQASSNQALISVNVTPNNAPAAQDGSASGNEDTPITGAAVATDSDGDGLSYTLSGANGGAQHGAVSMDVAGNFTYTPAPTSTAPTASPSRPTTAGSTATPRRSASPSTRSTMRRWPGRLGNAATRTRAISGTLVATDIDSATLTYSRRDTARRTAA